jgi:hypothetical protein
VTIAVITHRINLAAVGFGSLLAFLGCLSLTGQVFGQAPAAVPAEADVSFVSPYVENGLPADAMRTMLVDPALAHKMQTNRQMWFGGIMRAGVYVRPRAEVRENLNFSSSNTQNINRVNQNSQLWFFVNPTKDLELKLTVQDSRVWGGDGGASKGDDRAPYFSDGDTTSRSSVNVREAYLQFRNVIGLNGFAIQVGRQVLAYGDQRMLGGANWNASGLSYDGILIKYDSDVFSSHLFGVKGTTSAVNNVPNGVTSNTSTAQGDSYLAGLYNTIKTKYAWLEIYGIGMFRHAGVDTVTSGVNGGSYVATSSTNTQRSDLYTYGGRLTNRTDGNKLPAGRRWDFTLEAAFQAGNAPDVLYTDTSGNPATQSRTYNGKLFFAQTGYKVIDDLRLGAHVYYSPGTEDRTGSSLNTFQTLPGPRFGGFPYLNVFNGISENMGMKNIFTPAVSIMYEGGKWGDFVLTYLYENKATTQDAWYSLGGTANSNASPTTSGSVSSEDAKNAGNVSLGKNIYQEVDFVWMKTLNSYSSIWVGVGYLRAGDAVSVARGSDFKADAFMTFIQLTGTL